MAKREDVLKAMELVRKNRPEKSLEYMGKGLMGIFAVLHYLSEIKQAVTSKDISDALGVSSARMTVVLKKLESKKLIVKTHSTTDARALVITLTDKGASVAQELEQKRYECIETLVDEIGIGELTRVFETLNRMKMLIHESIQEQVSEGYDD